MFDHKLQEIINKQKICYFISPHFDDAVFSAGALMAELVKTNEIVVINLFTSPSKTKSSRSAKKFLNNCGYLDCTSLYKDRVIEDKNALKNIANNIINLGYVEALWRQKESNFAKFLARGLPELGCVYPTYRYHIIKGHIAEKDTALRMIKKDLLSIIDEKESVIFCPMGFGGHVDHLIARKACDEIFLNPIHWADYPYILDDNINNLLPPSFTFSKNMKYKETLIKEYKTQYEAIFGNNIELVPESYYLNS